MIVLVAAIVVEIVRSWYCLWSRFDDSRSSHLLPFWFFQYILDDEMLCSHQSKHQGSCRQHCKSGDKDSSSQVSLVLQSSILIKHTWTKRTSHGHFAGHQSKCKALPNVCMNSASSGCVASCNERWKNQKQRPGTSPQKSQNSRHKGCSETWDVGRGTSNYLLV